MVTSIAQRNEEETKKLDTLRITFHQYVQEQGASGRGMLGDCRWAAISRHMLRPGVPCLGVCW